MRAGATHRETAPRPSGGAVAREVSATAESAVSAEICSGHFAHCIAATAVVVPRQLLIPGPRGELWTEALPRTLIGRGAGALPGVAGSGTAFLVTPRHVVTAAHVVNPHRITHSAFVFGFTAASLRQPGDGLPLRYLFDHEAIAYGVSVTVPGATPCHDDISLIELSKPIERRGIAIAQPDAIALNQPVTLVGCAGLQPVTAAMAGVDPPARVLAFDERIAQTSVRVAQGNSGSPLLDSNGDALGVHVSMATPTIRQPASPSVIGNAGMVVASAVRMRVILDALVKIGAQIRT
ncbi:MAG: trypsin-like peptidase domain-containing protein [Rhodanobacteraceae bacterium]|nr:trypsin-like peptidase domain-containing protein [Rhodanobacteraceae bacterium]